MTEKVREAIKQVAGEIEHNKSIAYMKPALELLLDLAQQYLSAEMPEERVIDSKDWDSNIDFGEGYNQALRECRLALIKKCEECKKNSIAINCLWQIMHEYHEDNPERHLNSRTAADVAAEALMKLGEIKNEKEDR